MPDVSIALATHNGERYLAAQLESLSAQTALPTELVIADDSSSDGTLKIVQVFAQKAAFPVRVIQNEYRLGYRLNFIRAATACRGELIAFCDQDDIWHPEKLQIMQRAFHDRNVLLAYHNATLINKEGTVLGTLYPHVSATKIFSPLTMQPWMIIPGHAQVIRRSLVRFTELHSKSIDPYCTTELMPHDQWYPFWASVLGNIVYAPERLVWYRQHDTNASGWPHIGWFRYILDHISNAAHYVAGQSIGAKNRLALLHSCHDLLSSEESALINAAALYQIAFCALNDLRFDIYDKKTFAARLRALFGLLKQGGYTRRQPNLGLPALLLDAAIGAPLRRTVY